MKRILTFLTVIVIISFAASSCSRSVTPGDAASHHYGHCRDVR